MGRLRWQPVAAVAGLLAPPVALAALVWPASADGLGGGSDDPIALAVGDDADGQVIGGGATSYEITAGIDGPVRFEVLGGGNDPTLTVIDVESRDQLGYNDDANGVDSMLVLDLEAGQVVLAEVRSFRGSNMSFTIRVREATDGDDGGGGGGGGSSGPDTTIPAEGAAVAFEQPIGDEPIVIDGPNGTRITLREDPSGVCLEIERADGGSGTCGPSLEDLAGSGGGGSGSFDGRISVVDIVQLVGPEVATAAAVAGDDDEIGLDVLEIPGRVERIVIGQIRLPGDAFGRPGGTGYVVELRDADGAVIDSFPA